MDKIIIIIFSLLLLLAGVTSLILKKIYLFQYMNLKRGIVKGSIIQAILDNPARRQGVWTAMEDGFKFSLFRSVKIDNDTEELKRLTGNIQKTHYLTYVVIIMAFLLAFIVGHFYPNGLTIEL